MRKLKFIVDNQIIKQDPDSNFNDLVPGTEGYLRVEFSFSPEWNGFSKSVAFSSPMGKKYSTEILRDGKSCAVPIEALKRRSFKIQVIGEKSRLKITTNKMAVSQNGDES